MTKHTSKYPHRTFSKVEPSPFVRQAMNNQTVETSQKIATPSNGSRFACDFSRVPVRSSAVGPGAQLGSEQSEKDSIAKVRAAVETPGRSLSPDVLDAMAARLGCDFGTVQVHDDAIAAKSAEAIGASAYTLGRDVVFAKGRFQPHTESGRRLLVHELVHVTQQAGASTPRGLRVGSAAATHEREATDIATGVQSHLSVGSPAEVHIQRALTESAAPPQQSVPECGDTLVNCELCFDRKRKWNDVKGEDGGGYIYVDHLGARKRILDPEIFTRDKYCPLKNSRLGFDPDSLGKTQWPGGNSKKRK